MSAAMAGTISVQGECPTAIADLLGSTEPNWS